ncbi:MAG: CRTAC1 family protein [Thermoanaerobaculia bacterium]|nr:CRTAC1 family protein [Thermoanaerobaculia bacterium]
MDDEQLAAQRQRLRENQVFLQLSPDRFAEIGHLTGTDSDGDGRGVSVADVTGDLQPDLVVRQAGGGALMVFANRFPEASRLVVSLRGTRSNTLGLGASLIAETESLPPILRQIFPSHNFAASQPALTSFGLGSSSRVERLTIRWPSGEVQVLENVPTGLHIRVTEGVEKYEVLVDARKPDDGQTTPVARSGR